MRQPIGITPRFIHEEKRIHDIYDAIQRYLDAKKEIPLKWIEEYNELIKKQV